MEILKQSRPPIAFWNLRIPGMGALELLAQIPHAGPSRLHPRSDGGRSEGHRRPSSVAWRDRRVSERRVPTVLDRSSTDSPDRDISLKLDGS